VDAYSPDAPDGSVASPKDGSADGSPDAPATGDASTTNEGGSGPSGLEGFCAHYFQCGGTYYKDVADCVDQGVSYWGACKRPLLDAFGTCMMQVPCTNWDPSAYDPNATPCAAQWSAIAQAPACK
jgi:hypothetical protein